MGTRADFYLGKNEAAEWLGSIAWDGYRDGIPEAVLTSTTADFFRRSVSAFLAGRDDATVPERGWPWPWNTSATSDCSYWFFDGQVFDDTGGAYAPVSKAIESEEDYDAAKAGEEIQFPDMSASKNVRFDAGSGLIIVAA